jgi:hypothetical protein
LDLALVGVMAMRVMHRAMLVVFGLILVFAGLVAWGIEDEYGSGLNFFVVEGPATTTVYEESDGRRLLFEGTPQEARAYMERARAARESFLVPSLIIALGAVLVVVGLVPWRRLRS